MELTCPSCGIKHRTEDHPGAFEILCVCGYSLLVPDEQALAEAPSEPPPRTPLALDAEDSELAIPAPPAPDADLPESLHMTPPEELPEGMAYDPFEVPTDSALESPETASAFTPPLVPEETEASPETENSDSPHSWETAAQPLEAEAESAPPDSFTPPLVERIQRASLGQLLGHSYEVHCENLTDTALNTVIERCEKLLTLRPWLKSEARKRNLSFESLKTESQMTHVPEVLAMEIFLACFEQGGRCTLRRLESEQPSL